MAPMHCKAYFMMSFYSIFLSLIFFSVIFLLSKTSKTPQNEKGSPFECGFNNFTPLSISMPMPFFTMTLMFILFDVELMIISIKPISIYSSGLMESLYFWFVIFFIFMFTLYEWVKGILCWVFTG